MNFFFKFGNTPELSKLELDSVYQGGNPLEIADKLGGTVKIAEKIGPVSQIADYLISLKLPKIDFGISGKPELSKQIKRQLEEQGIKARFVLPREGDELSSVVVKKQKLIELIVEGDEFGRTIWVQDFESWNNRDYGRPAVDPHAGMLPPKVSRMMVNIAGPGLIFDPFCGVGTVLAEAQMVGNQVIGSDSNHSQVERTKKNLEWLNKGSFRVFQADAREVSKKMNEKVDAIVTEPDLGPNVNRPGGRSSDVEAKLASLYIASLEDWQKILKKDGKVVMVIPSWNISKDKQVDLVKTVLDKAILMGYSEFHNPIEYSRQQAIVKRNIVFLTHGTH